MLSIEDQKTVNLFRIKHLNEQLHLDSGSVFHVWVDMDFFTKDGETIVTGGFMTREGLGDRQTFEFFSEGLLDPRHTIETILLEIGCLPTWTWSEDTYNECHDGQFAHERNFKCSMDFMQSLKG